MIPSLFSLALQAAPAALSVSPETYWGLKPSEWIMIAAIIVGPLLAVVTQFIWQRVRQIRDQKLWVFGTLMSMRRFNISPDFVKALNFIDVVFYKEKKVRNKWEKLLTHLSSDAHKTENLTPQTLEHTRDLIAELLVEMAKALGFGYDYTHIKENAYYPMALSSADNETAQVRQKLIAALDGKGRLNVRLVEDQPVQSAYSPNPQK
jgi:hypothetical protein